MYLVIRVHVTPRAVLYIYFYYFIFKRILRSKQKGKNSLNINIIININYINIFIDYSTRSSDVFLND